MKKPPSPAFAVLAVLLCQVLAVAQVFAIAGGPPAGTGFSGGGTSLNLTGTYSGVLQGLTAVTPNNGSANDAAAAAAAIGLFDLGVTQTTGLATGTFLVFADGRVFTGTITGAADPGSGALQGILQASISFSVPTVDATGAVVAQAVTGSAAGRLDTIISGAAGGSLPTTGTTGGTTTIGGSSSASALVSLAGTASLDINFGQVDPTTLRPVVERILTFSVNGFRNSTTVVLTALTGAAGG